MPPWLTSLFGNYSLGSLAATTGIIVPTLAKFKMGLALPRAATLGPLRLVYRRTNYWTLRSSGVPWQKARELQSADPDVVTNTEQFFDQTASILGTIHDRDPEYIVMGMKQSAMVSREDYERYFEITFGMDVSW